MFFEISKIDEATQGKKDEVDEIVDSKEREHDNNMPTNADTHLKLPAEIGTDYNFRREIVWFNAIGFLAMHLIGLYGFYQIFQAKLLTTLFAIGLGLLSGEGVTIGAHRLFSHRTFKATFLLRLALVTLQTIAGQNCLYIWVRDHRQHHKYSDTDADPHNANRGFFFSHIGWLMSKKHPAVINKGKTIDMSDLEADWLVMFQKKYYKPLYVIFALLLPIGIPMVLWNETFMNSTLVSFFARYILVLNITWSVNSVAHFFGYKPYDQNTRPVESRLVSVLTQGEGWHNYHHAFPWDYRAAELGKFNSISTIAIDVLAKLGFIYDLRVASDDMIKRRVLRTGDGSHHYNLLEKENFIQNENVKENESEIESERLFELGHEHEHELELELELELKRDQVKENLNEHENENEESEKFEENEFHNGIIDTVSEKDEILVKNKENNAEIRLRTKREIPIHG